jgi:hypothetical protein
MALGITIRFQSPYNDCEERTQTFPTIDEANRMVELYKLCGSPAEVVTFSEGEK